MTHLGHRPASRVGVAKRVSPLSKHSFEPIRWCLLNLGADMRRRKFLGVLGGAVVAWPLTAHAQQALPIVGFLNAGSLDGYANHVAAFRQGLNDTGFVHGQNVIIEYRWAAGQYDRLPTLATELIAGQAAVLFASGGQLSVRAARAASVTIPVVFTSGADPVESGLVTSLSRPEGNTTGVSFTGRALGP